MSDNHPVTQRKFHCRRAPFTLIELMVILLIIGLVAGLVGPAIFERYSDAKMKSTKTQILLLRECVKSYYLDMNEYPRNLDDLVRNTGSGGRWKGPYIEDGRMPLDPWGNDFHYDMPGRDGRAFDIYSYGKDNSPGGEGENADIYSWTENK